MFIKGRSFSNLNNFSVFYKTWIASNCAKMNCCQNMYVWLDRTSTVIQKTFRCVQAAYRQVPSSIVLMTYFFSVQMLPPVLPTYRSRNSTELLLLMISKYVLLHFHYLLYSPPPKYNLPMRNFRTHHLLSIKCVSHRHRIQTRYAVHSGPMTRYFSMSVTCQYCGTGLVPASHLSDSCSISRSSEK